jgi:hypothetical protein
MYWLAVRNMGCLFAFWATDGFQGILLQSTELASALPADVFFL